LAIANARKKSAVESRQEKGKQKRKEEKKKSGPLAGCVYGKPCFGAVQQEKSNMRSITMLSKLYTAQSRASATPPGCCQSVTQPGAVLRGETPVAEINVDPRLIRGFKVLFSVILYTIDATYSWDLF
jgi:hypothetical protein